MSVARKARHRNCYDGPVKRKEPLEPLIPLDELKNVVAQIVNAPKEKVERVKADTKRKKD